MKQQIKLNEGQLRQIIKESVKKVLNESMDNFTSLRDFMTKYYDNDETCEDALNLLQDDVWLQEHGLEPVFHEGYGNGIYSPKEGIVAVFDEDDLPQYHSVIFYKYNPQAWKSTNNGGWDNIYAGDNGGDTDVEPITENQLKKGDDYYVKISSDVEKTLKASYNFLDCLADLFMEYNENEIAAVKLMYGPWTTKDLITFWHKIDNHFRLI